MAVELHAVGIETPEGANVVIGQSHFIKTVEDLYEVMITTVPGAKRTCDPAHIFQRCTPWLTAFRGSQMCPRA